MANLFSFNLKNWTPSRLGVTKKSWAVNSWPHMPAKPIKRVIKIWMLYDSNSSYLSKFDVYLCKNSMNNGNGLGYNVVDQLTNEIRHSSRHVYFDNKYPTC